MTDDLARLDATAQAELVRSGQASPLELVEAAIARVEAVNPELNAVIHERFEQARADAAGDIPDGPLRGVPIVMKDLDGWAAGEPYHAGTVHLRDRNFVAPADSNITRRFREAGAITVGRSNVPELGLVVSTESVAHGATRNPWNTGHSAGGSSGGSAATVASGMVPLASAGDGGGSIRIPSSECGLVGLKPSRGRVSVGPEAGEAWVGAVCRLAVVRSVRDAALVLDAVSGLMPGDPYTAPRPARPYQDEVGADPGTLRIGFTTMAPDPGVTTHAECVEAVAATARLLESLGHHVEEARPAAWADDELIGRVTAAFLDGFGVWVAADLDELGHLTGDPVTEDGVEPGTWAVAEHGRTVGGTQYLAAVSTLHEYGRALAPFWTDPGGFDLLLTPTLPEPPPTLGQFTAATDNPLMGLFRTASLVPFVAPFNMSGQPGVSLPVHMTADGLPVGVQLVAALGREDLLLRIGSQIEAAAPWADRRPAIHA